MSVRPFCCAPTTAHSTHGGVADQAVLDLRRRDPDPADLDQVVGAAAVPEVAVGVALEEVAGADAVAVKGLLRLLVLAPVQERGGVALDPELAVVGDVGLVAGHELARAARLRAAGPVGDVDVVRLGGADPVEHLDAEGLQPAVVQLLRQRLARGRAQAHRHARSCVCGLRMGDHLRHHRRDIDKDRRPVLGDQLEDPLGRGALGEDDPGGADAEREERGEVARVAEEELRHGEHDVVVPEVEHAARVPVEAEHRAVRGVDAAFGCPVQPVVNFQIAMSSFVVGAGSRSGEAPASRSSNEPPTTSSSRSQRLPPAASRIAASVVSSATTTPGPRVVEVVGVVLRREEGVRLGGDRADLLRAVPEGDELDGVAEHRAARVPRV